MPRALDFKLGSESFSATISKVDRSKLYGSVDLETRDSSGDECHLLTLAMDGKTLIPYGGTGFGYLSEDGEWRDKSSLNPIDEEGEPVAERESNFNFTNVLKEEASTQDLLDHDVRLVYQLDPVGGEFPSRLLSDMSNDKLYRFDFSYRGGVGTDIAFMVQGEDETVWLLIATPTETKFIGLQQATGNEEEEEESSGIDFEMF